MELKKSFVLSLQLKEVYPFGRSFHPNHHQHLHILSISRSIFFIFKISGNFKSKFPLSSASRAFNFGFGFTREKCFVPYVENNTLILRDEREENLNTNLTWGRRSLIEQGFFLPVFDWLCVKYSHFLLSIDCASVRFFSTSAFLPAEMNLDDMWLPNPKFKEKRIPDCVENHTLLTFYSQIFFSRFSFFSYLLMWKPWSA